MINIRKLENVFGIKKVDGLNSLGSFNVVYAPNGTAKTSLSDAICCLARGDGDFQEKLKDVYMKNSEPVIFELDVDGKSSTNDHIVPFSVIRYSGVEKYQNDAKSEYTNLVAAPDTLKRVQAHGRQYNLLLERAGLIILRIFPTRGGSIVKKYEAPLRRVIGAESINSPIDIAKAFYEHISLSNHPFDGSLTLDDFTMYCDPKFVDVVSIDAVRSKLKIFIDKADRVFKDTVFDESFTMDDLQAIIDACEQHHFFDSEKRAININGRNYSKIELDKLVSNAKIQVFGSDETKKEFDEVKKTISRKPTVLKTIEQTKARPEILRELVDINKFMESSLLKLLGQNAIEELLHIKDALKEEQDVIDALLKNYDGKGSLFNDLWQKFKTRFSLENFELRIENRSDAIAGRSVPRFIKISKIDGKPIELPETKRFSTGEARAFYLVNLVIDIELAIQSGKPTLVLLDDAVDSFDYKNKYATMEYIVDAAGRGGNLQFLVFTHNFDFYRSLILAMDPKPAKQLFAYSKDGIVTLYDASSSPYFLQLSSFNEWANRKNVDTYLALLPFLRNIIQLNNGSGKSEDFKKVCDYFHYTDALSSTLTCVELQSLYEKYMERVTFPDQPIVKIGHYVPGDESVLYFEFIEKVVKEIVGTNEPINETKLEFKIVLCLYLRLACEKFIHLQALRNLDESALNDSGGNIKSLKNKLIDSGKLSDEQSDVLLQVSVIAPAYAHANSFMYEPLIDVGTGRMIPLVKWFLENAPLVSDNIVNSAA